MLVAALIAWLLRPQESTLLRVAQELKALENVEDAPAKVPSVAVGYGACYDIFAEATPLLPYDASYGEPEHFDTITTLSELHKSFAYYFRHGAAAE